MKRLITALAMIFVATFSFKCENENLKTKIQNNLEILVNTDTKFEVVYETEYGRFNFESFITNGVVTSYLRINDNGEQIIETKNVKDTNIPSFKLMIHKSVIDESIRLINQPLVANVSISLISQFEDFAKQILSNKAIDYSSDLIQGLFVHNAILNTARRSIQTNSKCNCTPHPSYFVDQASFWCQEDYTVDTEKFTKAIIESGYQLTSKELEVLNYLQRVKEKEKFITIDRLLEIMEDRETYMNRVETQYLIANGMNTFPNSAKTQGCTQGGGLGCCGNYSGCCWVWSLACLEHDIVCHDCARWHCGWGCVASW